MSFYTFLRTVGLKMSHFPLQDNNLMIWLCIVRQQKMRTFFLEYFNYVLASLNLHRPTNGREALVRIFQRLMQVAQSLHLFSCPQGGKWASASSTVAHANSGSQKNFNTIQYYHGKVVEWNEFHWIRGINGMNFFVPKLEWDMLDWFNKKIEHVITL